MAMALRLARTNKDFMNLAIYTIAKNEAHNVEAFMQSAEGCPVYVLDTGSTDNTVELLKEHGAHVVQKIIDPWRFDTARNEALALVPDDVDVCVSVDMDERLDTGWQNKLKAEWSGNVGSYFYIAEWADKACTIPSVQSPRTRLHSRHDYEWHRQIHEVIRPLKGVEQEWCDTSIVVKHYQDGKQRNYSPALRELLKENPNDADGWLQLAGECHQVGNFGEALDAYKQYLKVIECDEREVLRYRRAHAWISIAQCLHKLGKTDEVVRAFLSAIAAEPNCREAWTHFSHVALQMGNAPLAYGSAMTAYSIKQPPYHAATEAACWGELPKEIADHAFGLIMKQQGNK
jgi:glycosyltransferase involved in cell wall biosynthesis